MLSIGAQVAHGCSAWWEALLKSVFQLSSLLWTFGTLADVDEIAARVVFGAACGLGVNVVAARKVPLVNLKNDVF